MISTVVFINRVPDNQFLDLARSLLRAMQVVAQTVHIFLFFRKIAEIERFALRATILLEWQTYLAGGDGLVGSEKNIFLAPSH